MLIENILFYVAFLSQIFLISYYYPRKILGRMRYVLETYPPSTHPKLYPKPVEYYKKAQRNFRIMNQLILLVGMILIAMLLGISRSGKWDHVIVTWYFLLQSIPLILVDLRSYKELKLMRSANSSTTRKAELRPRRLLDFVSPTTMGMALITYLGFISLILYIRQFEFPWFGGYWNIVGVTVINLCFAAIILWNMYGKKLNPHQTYEDRMRQIENVVKILVFTSIAATMFLSINIVLAALNLRNLQSIVQCLYFLLVAVICIRAYLLRQINFEVYKENPLAA